MRQPATLAAPAAAAAAADDGSSLVSDLSTITVHGRRAAFRRAGRTSRPPSEGKRPCIVLVHGIAGDSPEWAPVLQKLSERYDVAAPDLAGHGDSARPRGDHSIG